MLADILFYLFSGVLLLSALVVVSTRNTIHSVMFLILAFFNAAGLFVLLGAEFLAMLLVIVYVGAIAVLFLFVVMMLNVDDNENSTNLKKGFNKYSLLAFLLAGILFVEIFLMLQSSALMFDQNIRKAVVTPADITNTEALGNILYTKFIYPFQISGMILFVAMIGAIVLTIRDQDRFIKKQVIGKQVERTRSDSVKLVKAESGKGINI